MVAGLPSNPWPRWVPVEGPTIRLGVAALLATAHEWLDPPASRPATAAGVQAAWMRVA